MTQTVQAASRPSRARRAAAEATADFPFVPEDLLEALERVFPDRCPDGELTDAEIRERIGECRVLRFLKRHQQRQERLNQERIL